MKRVHLIRHAKSSRDDPGLADLKRPLAPRGRRDAPVMAARMREAGVAFDVVYSSPAVRAVDTARLLVEGMGESNQLIALVEELYDADADDLIAFLTQRPASVASVGMVLHNPAATDLANAIGDLEVENLPTCAVYSVTFDVNRWSQIGEVPGHTTLFDRPPKER